VSLTEKIDTTDAAGRAILHIIADFAQFQRYTISQRTRASLATARKVRRMGGRPKALTCQKIDQAAQLVEGGTSMQSVARTLTVEPSTLSAAIEQRDVRFK
jgi:DNA invertase Pin-like site-specific DNA recombinase